MQAEKYRCLKIEVERGVATLTLDHPPINLFDAALMGEMDRAGRELEADPDVRWWSSAATTRSSSSRTRT